MDDTNTMISKMILEIDGKRVELTMDQARRLHAELNILFKDPNTVYIPYTPYTPYIPYVTPYTPSSDYPWIVYADRDSVVVSNSATRGVLGVTTPNMFMG